LANIKAPKNGYVYIYVSNESDEPVYFDNLQVQHVRGRIIEENHYYAFGLKIAGISSRQLSDAAEGHVDNPYGYQGNFSELDEEIGWNDFELRNYDPQMGRWIQQDPYDEFESPYVGMGNDPVNNVDEDGGFSVPGAVIGGIAGFIAGGAYALAGDHDPVAGAFIGAVGGAALGGLIGSINFSQTGQTVENFLPELTNITKHATEPIVSSTIKVVAATAATVTPKILPDPANLRPIVTAPPPAPVVASRPTPTQPAVRQPAVQQPPPPPPPARQGPGNRPGNIHFGQNARQNAVTAFTRQVLQEIMRESGNNNVTITSTQRTPAEQARVMYQNIVNHGAASQHRLYGRGGDAVIDVAESGIADGLTPAQIISNMTDEILRIGPTNVSNHTADPNVLNVVDIDPSTVEHPRAFVQAIESRGIRLLQPPTDPAFHLEIRQPR